jgi:hypothetical protein
MRRRRRRPRARGRGGGRDRGPRRGRAGRRVPRSSPRGSERLDGEHARERVDGAAELPGRRPAHRDVVLLHRRRRDRVDARRHRQPLALVHEGGLRVLGDHVARVDAGVVGEERRQAVAAGLVEHPVGATLRHRRHVGERDGEEVEDVRDRGAVEVAVRLDPAVVEHDRVVDRGRELGVGDAGGVVDGVAQPAGDLRGAAQRVGVLDAGVLRRVVRGDDGRAGQHPPHVRRGRALARLGSQHVQVGGERLVGAEQGLDAHRCGDVGDGREHPQVGEREQQHAEHAVGAVDEREALLGLQRHRLDAVLGEDLAGGSAGAGGVVDLALAQQRQRDGRQGREVAGAPERAVLVHDRRDAGVEQRRERVGDDRADAGVPGGERP